jgi:hypothetical protein
MHRKTPVVQTNCFRQQKQILMSQFSQGISMFSQKQIWQKIAFRKLLFLLFMFFTFFKFFKPFIFDS